MLGERRNASNNWGKVVICHLNKLCVPPGSLPTGPPDMFVGYPSIPGLGTPHSLLNITQREEIFQNKGCTDKPLPRLCSYRNLAGEVFDVTPEKR